MTLQELENIVESIKITVDSIDNIYTTKTQWKQLDLLRKKDIDDIKESIVSIQQFIDSIDLQNIDTSEYVTKTQWKQLDLLNKEYIESINNEISNINSILDSIDIQNIDISEYVTKTQWKQLDLLRLNDMQSILDSISSINNSIDFINSSMSNLEYKSNKNMPNGYAGLGSDGKIFNSQLPTLIADSVEWDNILNIPTTIDGGTF